MHNIVSKSLGGITYGEYVSSNREKADRALGNDLIRAMIGDGHFVIDGWEFNDEEGEVTTIYFEGNIYRVMNEIIAIGRKSKSIDEILDIPMDRDDNDAAAESIGDYLRVLFLTLWQEKEGFNSKRPFGNSCWEFELAKPLIKHGIIEGKLDDDGYIDDVDKKALGHTIGKLINHVFGYDYTIE